MRPTVAAILLPALAALAAAQKPTERVVKGTVLTSDDNPKVRIELPRGAKYLGGERWDLYSIADCELHVWVEADEGKTVTRLYWVQFEGYLPSQPERRYNYPFSKTMKIADLDFDVRTRASAGTAQQRPDSDGAHVSARVQSAGYRLPRDLMSVRLVHLPDEQKRKELMIIYMEDLGPAGVTASDLQPGGKASDRWAELERGLLERVTQKVKLSR
ncbi:MAG: hypothetical protein SFV54_00070 [Bryobacteraceae bacterium]|nr:hypothetical protein [Bryobacteraceae bacterium]